MEVLLTVSGVKVPRRQFGVSTFHLRAMRRKAAGAGSNENLFTRRD